MLYPNHKIEDIFKLVHKTQDPKDIQWVIDNLDRFNYSSGIYSRDYSYKDEDDFYYYYYDCSYINLINFIIVNTVATEEQKDYLYLLRKAKSFIFNNKNISTTRFPNNLLYFLSCTQIQKRPNFDYLKNPFEEPSWFRR